MSPVFFSYVIFLDFYSFALYIFRSMIHFEFTFMRGGRSVSKFILLCVDVIKVLPLSVVKKDYLCSIVLPLLLCQESVDYILGIYF